MSNSLGATITSVEVAEMVGKEHNDVLKDIRRISSHLGEGKSSQSYFIESTYINSQNKELPSFNLTKKGCELFSTRMTGAKGTQFAVAYIDRFNEMESHLNQPNLTSPREQLRLMFAYQEETTERVEVIESDIKEMKENQLLTSPDYDTISQMVRRKVNIIAKEQHLVNKQKSLLFKDLNSGIKVITGAINRQRIKAKQFEAVVEFINNWQPSTATNTLIKQICLEV